MIDIGWISEWVCGGLFMLIVVLFLAGRTR